MTEQPIHPSSREVTELFAALDFLENAAELLDAGDTPDHDLSQFSVQHCALVVRLRALTSDERAEIRRSVLTDTDGFVHVGFDYD